MHPKTTRSCTRAAIARSLSCCLALAAAAAVTLASSYALGDLSGQRQGLDLRVREAKSFYGVFAGLLIVAGAITLVASNHLLSLITLMVQAMCGLMLPSTTIFVLLLSNDRDILGPWINRRWLNILASIIVTILVVLSDVMMVSTLFTSVNVVRLLVVTSIIAALALSIAMPIALRRTRERVHYDIDRSDWRMPRLSLLSAPTSSAARRWLLRAVATYLVVAGVLLVVRFIQLAVS